MDTYCVEGIRYEDAVELIMLCAGSNISATIVPGGLEFLIEQDELETLKELCGKVGAVPTFGRTFVMDTTPYPTSTETHLADWVAGLQPDEVVDLKDLDRRIEQAGYLD